MKNLAILLLCLFSFSTYSFAQTTDKDNKVTKEDYKRYIDSKLEMDFRNETVKALELTRDEIIAFDPIFRNYMNAKDRLLEKKMDLLEEFREEMQEDDSVKNQNEDRADFIEDYWEVEIDEMELRKDYFDRLEDAIAVDKAIKFFLWEDAIGSQVKYNAMVDILPTIVTIEAYPISSKKADDKMSAKWKKDKASKKDKLTAKGSSSTKVKLSADTKNSLNTFNEWNMSNKGKVDISHEYTAQGLNALMSTLEGLNSDMKLNLPSFDEKKKMVMNVASTIQKDPYSLKHADMVHKAFVAIGEMMQNVNKSNDLTMIGKKIDPDVMLTKQAAHIYNFFETANNQLQDYTKYAKGNNSTRK